MFATSILGFTISAIWLMMFLVVWIVIAFWPARVASRKGHSFLLFFLFSLVFFFLALLVAYMVPDRTQQPLEQVSE